jgi:hypothetical protein
VQRTGSVIVFPSSLLYLPNRSAAPRPISGDLGLRRTSHGPQAGLLSRIPQPAAPRPCKSRRPSTKANTNIATVWRIRRDLGLPRRNSLLCLFFFFARQGSPSSCPPYSNRSQTSSLPWMRSLERVPDAADRGGRTGGFAGYGQGVCGGASCWTSSGEVHVVPCSSRSRMQQILTSMDQSKPSSGRGR